MTLSLVIAINVLADVALLCGLAYAMSHAARLTPHVSARDELALRRVENADRRAWRRPRHPAPAPTRVA
jgi:hypothetical protein